VPRAVNFTVFILINMVKLLLYYYTIETWPTRKENDVALQRAEMRMVR